MTRAQIEDTFCEVAATYDTAQWDNARYKEAYKQMGRAFTDGFITMKDFSELRELWHLLIA